MQRRMPDRKNMTAPQRMAKNMSRFAFVMCLLVIVVVFLFYQYKNGDFSSREGSVKTEVEKLSTKDLDLGYPATPAEVMKLFGRINQCLYNTNVGDEELNQLLTQMRLLYSKSLLEQNPFEEQKDNLLKEKEEFSASKRRIANYTVDKSSSVKYREINEQECAYIQMAYFMSENSKYSKSFQDYILVKEDKRWKILGFKKGEEAEQKLS